MSTYKCPNCWSLVDGDDVDVSFENPMCPECNVESLTEMCESECHDCGNSVFKIIQKTEGASITGADATAVCTACGRKGNVDEDGVWW